MSQEASLYRRHRPRSFDQVVGQRHVVRTLSNAIEQGKVHHAYLFVGSRGTGKTSMAKILAASLNCVNGPTLTPCGVCESCQSIAAGTSVDVIEMDAASNRSVDDIRELRERVAFAPTSGHWKIYILDEAHMLTKEAWNAFLKTLEEPPPNTAFILATTEAHKVMPTIADRCQRFDFQRPTIEQLAEVVNRAATAESVEIEPAAVSMIARAASGSFRDALGTLDQLISFTGNQVGLDAVLDLLGATDTELLFGAVDAVVAGDPGQVLDRVEQAVRSGQDPARFARELLGHLRVLLVTRATGEIPEAFAITTSEDGRLRSQAEAFGPANLMRTIDELAGALGAVRDGDDARMVVEVALVKAARPEYDPSTEGLMRRIERLEQGSVPPPPPPAPRPSAGSDRPAAGQPSPAAATDRGAESGPAAAAAPPKPAAVSQPARPEAVEAAPPPTDQAPPPDEAPPPVEEPAAPPVGEVPPPAAEPAAAPSAPATELDLERLRQAWPAVIDAIRTAAPGPAASYFEGSRPVEVGPGRVAVGFPAEAAFNRRNAEKPEGRQRLVEAIRSVTGVSVAVEFGTLEQETPGDAGVEKPKQSKDEVVAEIKSAFNAEEVI